ncbi:hypothetical protein HX785_02040 [Pseudomonas reactans]|uniref:hypothetical protein n=1 Tax=Pseudomonas reactans TaxID=117680 RepID=UPI0015A1F073|nr:hypothetical protein [Pseudomonas reactans]NWF12453.1 hypothetical protein [Pseudomonas reactans]
MTEDLLKSFSKEVMQNGPESTLPCNLSDQWLEVLSAQLEDFFENDSDECLSLPMMAVLHILFAKSKGEAISETHNRLFDHLCNYRIELGLEEIRRKTDVSIEPASLESILTNRRVTFE